MRCALITNWVHDWFAAIALACPGIEFIAPPGFPNPFDLPEDDCRDVTLVANWAYDELARDGSLRKLQTDAPLVGLDGADTVALGFPPAALERFDLVIKAQGLYRDRELYNYLVGPQSPNANWTEKRVPRRRRYRPADLEKLRLSLPCFALNLAQVRRDMRSREAGAGGSLERRMPRAERTARDAADALLALMLRLPSRRSREVHRLYGLSHTQRLQALALLEGFRGEAGIINVHREITVPEAEWKPYLRKPLNRARFLLSLRRHKITIAPTGHGELTFRHAEAWRTGSALICQDLSHIETMFPFQDGENVAYCRPDLSDLREVVRRLLSDNETRERIAETGRQDYHAWATHWRELLIDGFKRHLEEALMQVPRDAHAGH